MAFPLPDNGALHAWKVKRAPERIGRPLVCIFRLMTGRLSEAARSFALEGEPDSRLEYPVLGLGLQKTPGSCPGRIDGNIRSAEVLNVRTHAAGATGQSTVYSTTSATSAVIFACQSRRSLSVFTNS
jgi:hypothetical protein